MFLSSYCFLVERNYNQKGLKRKIIVGLPKHPASKITSVGNQDMAVKFVGLRQLSNLDVPPRYGEVTIVARPTHVQSSLSVPKSIYCKLAIMKPFLLKKKTNETYVAQYLLHFLGHSNKSSSGSCGCGWFPLASSMCDYPLHKTLFYLLVSAKLKP